jgi:hypothetical protein
LHDDTDAMQVQVLVAGGTRTRMPVDLGRARFGTHRSELELAELELALSSPSFEGHEGTISPFPISTEPILGCRLLHKRRDSKEREKGETACL